MAGHLGCKRPDVARRNKTAAHSTAIRKGIAASAARRAASARRRGVNHPGWKGGRRIVDGYVMVRVADHPRGKYVPEQVLIVEAVLGRYLKTFTGRRTGDSEEVHHINHQRSDNRKSNLLVCTRSYHAGLEQRYRALIRRAG